MPDSEAPREDSTKGTGNSGWGPGFQIQTTILAGKALPEQRKEADTRSASGGFEAVLHYSSVARGLTTITDAGTVPEPEDEHPVLEVLQAGRAGVCSFVVSSVGGLEVLTEDGIVTKWILLSPAVETIK